MIDVYPPTGTIKIINGTISVKELDLKLICNDHDKNNIEIVGGCKSMAFSLNGNFTNSEVFDFAEDFTHTAELIEGDNTLYVQFTDDSPQSNISIEEITDDVIFEVTQFGVDR